MKPEDMLPPGKDHCETNASETWSLFLEEKEKRKDDFEKEVQKIMEAEEQTAEEMARRAKIKVTRQGIVDNDSVFPVFQPVRNTRGVVRRRLSIVIFSFLERRNPHGRKGVQTEGEIEDQHRAKSEDREENRQLNCR